MYRKSGTSPKPPKHEFCCTAEFAFIKPSTDSEDQLEYHKNTIFNNFNRFIDITNKTGFITLKLDYTGLEYMPISLSNRIHK